ncbi:uncharacterized protein LOC130630318 [Hydractinia symbiolongicarpus]|uniref:uncharacterized protein LOC130630318 n=1 Tax=Hydractinia symbiolongicarpus TaxID=13093 RepID=UPI00254CEBDC|nr:uncharacterized protein LOC130630318 [Hydractinia symbiolongicarpus]
MNLLVIFSVCVIFGYQNVNGDLMNELMETLLSDPNTRELVKKAEAKMEAKDQNPAGMRTEYGGGFRGGDASSTKQDAIYNKIKELVEKSKSKKENSGLPWTKKEKSGLPWSKKEKLGLPWSKKDRSELPWSKKDRSELPWSKKDRSELPWSKKDITNTPNGLPWKRTLYKRVMNDINDLFSMTDKTEEKKSTDDELVDELSGLFKRT